jgi:hypothetical protein
MRMLFMQEARRESVSASYVWKNARFDHWVIRVSRALVRFFVFFFYMWGSGARLINPIINARSYAHAPAQGET